MLRKKSSGKLDSILVIGGSGFVGSEFLRLSKLKTRFIYPTGKELDIANRQNLEKFILKIQPESIINFAAITNMDDSEKERGSKKEKTWQVNFEGVRNLVKMCSKKNIFLIQISTDAVFPGDAKRPGPYSEKDRPPQNGKGINWYGYTKLKAENEIKKLKKGYAIIRISHPFGNPTSPRDLVNKTIKDIKIGNKLFFDQFFTPTFTKDLALVIDRILTKRISGIFHVGCKKIVSRLTFDRYLAKKIGMPNNLIKGSMEEFIKLPDRAPRTRLGGFTCENTEKRLNVVFHSWKAALNDILRTIPKFS